MLDLATTTTTDQRQAEIARLPLPPIMPRSIYTDAYKSPYNYTPGNIFLEAYNQLGPIFRIRRQDGRIDTVLAGAAANHFMQVEGSANYTHAKDIRRVQNETFGIRRSVISMGGEEHYRFRRLHKDGYSRSSVDHQYPVIIDTVREFIDSWEPGQLISMEEVMPRIIAELLCRVVVNHTTVQDYYEDIKLYTRLITMTTVAQLTDMKELESEAFKRAERRTMQHAAEIVAAHRATKEGRLPDVLDDALAANEAEPGLFNEQELRYTALGGYVGGLDSVAYTCAFMLYGLLDNPSYLQRVLDEIDPVFNGKGLTPKTLRPLIDLRHATYETLRMYPVSFAVKSTVHKDFEFDGYRVDAGTELISATAVSHFVDHHFPQPFKFDIDRYVAPRFEHRQQGAYAPYGTGIHICLGAGLADILTMLTVATLLHEAEFEIDPPDYKMQIEVRPTPVPKNLNLLFRKRRK